MPNTKLKTIRPETKRRAVQLLQTIVTVDRIAGRLLTAKLVSRVMKITLQEFRNSADVIRHAIGAFPVDLKKYRYPNMRGRVPADKIKTAIDKLQRIPESSRIKPGISNPLLATDHDDTPDNNEQDELAFQVYLAVCERGPITAEDVARVTGYPLDKVSKELKRQTLRVTNKNREWFQLIKAVRDGDIVKYKRVISYQKDVDQQEQEAA